MQPLRWQKTVGAAIRHAIWEGRRVLLTASGVAGCVILLRFTGLLQVWELSILDQFFHLRPLEPVDTRIVLVGIGEEDLRRVGQWPIPDQTLAQLLEKIAAAKPRAIGLDLYRDLTVEPGHQRLLQAYAALPHLVGIEKLRDQESLGVAPPPNLNQSQVGFNNVVYDLDRKVRRALLYWKTDHGQLRESFALKLALLYLEQEGIKPQPAVNDPRYLQLGQGVFRKLGSNNGPYVATDAGGYQVWANFRGPSGHFRLVSMEDVMAGRVPPEQFQNRIVLIGSTAVSLKDHSATPYSSSWTQAAQLTSGVEIQANFTSQILSGALEGRRLLWSLPDAADMVWIVLWSGLGAGLAWWLRPPLQALTSIALAAMGLTGVCYGAFVTIQLVLPLVPPLLALTGSAFGIMSYIAYLQEELKRSKEFLHTIINTIPDPVFVKDSHHRWIVLNSAYSRFIGYPIEELLEKNDYDVFPWQEAETFQQQDNWVLQKEQERESEECFTDRSGVTHLIATKRSLHKDAAGNRFLVGVIRDITERKRIEEELKLKAAELARSNEELKLSQDHLSYLANHDVLTGLPNRKLFYERLRQSLEWAVVHQQLVALLFLDLDGFKQINDKQGHEVGDRLLQAVAQRLIACLRGTDTVARLGGDEFTIILPAIPSPQNAATVAEKILATLAQPFAIDDHTLRITTSIGISLYPLHSRDTETLIRQADGAMYQTKQQGKNGYQFAVETLVADG